MAHTVSKAAFLAAVMKRRQLIRQGKFRVKLPSPPNPFRLIGRRKVREQEENEFKNYLTAFEGKGGRTILSDGIALLKEQAKT